TRNGVGFPKHSVAVLQQGNQAIRVAGQISRVVQPAEWTTNIDLLIFKIKFMRYPERLLHICGIDTTPDFQHDSACCITVEKCIINRSSPKVARLPGTIFWLMPI